MAQTYEVIDRYGRLVDRTGEDLRDGDRLRVPMYMRDSMTPIQRAVAEDVAARSAPIVDGLGRPAGQRSGFCYAAASATQVTLRHLADQARREWIDEMQTAWQRKLPGECVPAAPRQDAVPRTMSVADAQAIRDAAYRQYCDELVNAWKAR